MKGILEVMATFVAVVVLANTVFPIAVIVITGITITEIIKKLVE